jgi:hypothetical protein
MRLLLILILGFTFGVAMAQSPKKEPSNEKVTQKHVEPPAVNKPTAHAPHPDLTSETDSNASMTINTLIGKRL